MSKHTNSPQGSTAQLAYAEAESRSFPRRLLMTEQPPRLVKFPASGSRYWPGHGSPLASPGHQAMSNPDEVKGRGSMNELSLPDRDPGMSKDLQPQARARVKRRAPSPPLDAPDERSLMSNVSGHGNVCNSRCGQQSANKYSLVLRSHPNDYSLSSNRSVGPGRSFLSFSLGIPSSVADYGSGHDLSPSALWAMDPITPETPGFAVELFKSNPVTKNRSPRDQIQGATHRAPSGSVVRSRTSGVSQAQNDYVCACCPSTPRNFDTEQELRNHESQKQHTCPYCPNRFKNKNEAKRHRNSLHLRQRSWSCAALAGTEAAFHTSFSGNGADVCGYCGEIFPNPPQWNIRLEHLNHAHKFGECNKSKRFFRADHFRQHLKHSHSGTSGKWTNMLELACTKAETTCLPNHIYTSSTYHL